LIVEQHKFYMKPLTTDCPFNCLDKGTCIDNLCRCSIGFIGPYCEFSNTLLRSEDQIVLNLKPQEMGFFYILRDIGTPLLNQSTRRPNSSSPTRDQLSTCS
jgi:hypothetical protein